MTFYFIAGEPSSLITMVNMAYLIKKANPNNVVEAIVPYHGFLEKLDVGEFLDEFDKVWYLPICNFQRNVFRGFLRGTVFKKSLKRIVFKEGSMAFAFISSEMSVNLVIKHLDEKYKKIKVVLLNHTSKEFDIKSVGGRVSGLMTCFDRLYSLLLGCYPMKSYVTTEGLFMHRVLCKELPFSMVVLSVDQLDRNNRLETLKSGEIKLPYPTVIRDKKCTEEREKFVVYFGDATIADFYVKLDKQFLANRTAQYANAICDYYNRMNIKVYYKPHPFDGDNIMDGCESSKFHIFKEKLNAEMLFSKYHNDIIAAYTISSHSVFFGSKYGIPAYWAYEICYSDEELKEFFRKVPLGSKSKLLKSLTSLDQIGSIDDDKAEIDTNKMVKAWECGIKSIISEC